MFETSGKSEYEFVLDEEDYCQYMKREEIRTLIIQKDYKQAEKQLLEYEKEYGEKFLHGQFVFLHKGLIKKAHQEIDGYLQERRFAVAGGKGRNHRNQKRISHAEKIPFGIYEGRSGRNGGYFQ